MKNYREFIHIQPEVRFGRPSIIGTRIAVSDVLGWLAAGMTHQEIIADYPELTEAQIQACLAFVAEKENRIVVA